METLDKKLRGEYPDNMFFKPFMGKKGDNSPIIWEDQLKGKNGDVIKMATLNLLTGNGISGDETLEASEETMVYYWNSVPVNQHRHAVVETGKMSQQRGPFDVIKDASKALTLWWGTYIDEAIFHTIYYGWPKHIGRSTATGGLNWGSTNARPCFRWFCADEANNTITHSYTDTSYISSVQDAEGALANVSTDKMQPSIIEGVGVKMRAANFPPLSMKGFTGFLGILHPYQTAQLRTHTDWFNAMIQGTPRSVRENPVFAGVGEDKVIGVWNNILLMESNKIHNGEDHELNDSGNIVSANTNGAYVRRAIFMGAGGVAYAEAVKPHFEVKKDFDYNNIEGIAIAGIFGAVRGEYAIDTASITAKKQQNTIVVSTYSPETTI